METAGRLVYPEIECWPAIDVQEVAADQNYPESQTIPIPNQLNSNSYIDLVEVTAREATHVAGLDDMSLPRHISESSNMLDKNGKSRDIPLKIFFIHEISPDIGMWFTRTFGTSPLFLQLLEPQVIYRNDGATSFSTKDPNKNVISVDGFYQISSGLQHSSPSYLWFKHVFIPDQKVSSTYIIHRCPFASKRKIMNLLNKDPVSLMRPLSVDALVVAERLNFWGNALHKEHSLLLPYITNLQNPQLFTNNKAVYDLQHLSEHFNVIRTCLEDVRELIDYLINIHATYPGLNKDSVRGRQDQYGSIGQSLSYLLSQNMTMSRWVTSYIEHTGIVMNVLFNLFTSAIAVSTQQDSSSMITMAAVTMFFLPGTFVSALFSMVFFNSNSSNSGLVVNSQLWLFFIITVPLTIAVFATWEIWSRRRRNSLTSSQMAAARVQQKPPSMTATTSLLGGEEPSAFVPIEDGFALRESPASSLRSTKASRSRISPALIPLSSQTNQR